MSTRDELYAVLVPLHGDPLLLPNAMVAEVLSAEGLEPVGSGARVGVRDWNGKRLRVVSFEALNGGAPPPANTRTRILVLHPLEQTSDDGACGLLTQGYPHLLTLTRGALVAAPLQAHDVRTVVAARARIANTQALIPNLDAIFEAAR